MSIELNNHHHFVELVINAGELHPNFRCAAPEDAPCRRRPPGDRYDAEFFTYEEATELGYQCWAVEWVEAVGIEDAIIGSDGVLSSVPVGINYREGVEITVEHETAIVA